jgi:hypothetical protein
VKASKDVASAYVLHPRYALGPYFRWAEGQTKWQDTAEAKGTMQMAVVDIQAKEMYKRAVPDYIPYQGHRKWIYKEGEVITKRSEG